MSINKFNLTKEQLSKIDKLINICLEYNKNVNLTSIKDKDEFYVKHILDSLQIINFYDLKNKLILDIGSGAGFPGIVLAIVFPNSKITLIDSNNKKIKYLNYAIQKLDIQNIEITHGRIEDQKSFLNKFDIVISRAVASLNILLEISFFTVKKDGMLVFYKGKNYLKEYPKNWNEVENKLKIKFIESKKYLLKDNIERYLITFKKSSLTNTFLPRPFAKIKKEPIY